MAKKPKALWGGRFKKGLAESAIQMSYSLEIDQALITLAVNLAHAKALKAKKILSESEFKLIQGALKKIASEDINQEKITTIESIAKNDEDIHSFIERRVIEIAGEVGKKLHTGKSRNDQVITDVRLYVKENVSRLVQKTDQLLASIITLAESNPDVIFPGFTHFQPAQPVLFAHHILAYYHKFNRDKTRFNTVIQSADCCPLGSGALAGNNYELDRDLIAKELGFSSITANSMDAVSDRDFLLEFFSAASIMMTHFSRFCEELVLWSSPIMGFITIGDEYTTGSSIMPQKKNPDMAELIRGKGGRVLGHLVQMHHVLKSLPLTYNRDLQEDKESLFDTVKTLDQSITVFAEMIGTIQIDAQKMKAATRLGFPLATELADYLVKKGIPFREAHEIVGKIVIRATETGRELAEIPISEYAEFSAQITADILDHVTLEAAINAKNVPGGTAKNQVQAQLKAIKSKK